MARLTLLNGPPGSGKSTLARMYVDEHPLVLNLDVDLLRRLLGRWQDRAQESGLLARQIALSAATTHLRAGHDVVVPQYLGYGDFIAQLASVAAEVGADFHEVVLMTSREEAVRRFEERTQAATELTHVEAGRMAAIESTPDAVGAMHDRLLDLLERRPNAVIVDAVRGDPSATYQRFVSALGTDR